MSQLTMSVETVLYVASAASSISFSPTAGHFNAGSISAGGGTVTYAGNVAFQVSVAATAATWAGSSKPASDLQWSRNGGSTWMPFSTAAQNFHSTTSVNAGRYDVTTLYRVMLPYASSPPGTFTLGFTYTVLPN